MSSFYASSRFRNSSGYVFFYRTYYLFRWRFDLLVKAKEVYCSCATFSEWIFDFEKNFWEIGAYRWVFSRFSSIWPNFFNCNLVSCKSKFWSIPHKNANLWNRSHNVFEILIMRLKCKFGPFFSILFVNFCFFFHLLLHFWLFKRTLFYQSSTYVNVFLIIPELGSSFGREVFLFYKNVHIIIQFSRFFCQSFQFFCLYFEFINR